MLTWLLSSGLGAMVSFWWRWSLKIVAIWVDLNYSRRPQLFRLRLKLKSIPQRPLRFVEELSCSYNIIVAFVELFVIDRSRIPYQEKGFIRIKTVSFHSGENITYSVFLKINFIVPISSIQLQISILTSFTQTKGTIQSVWSDLMTSILPHWLTPPLLFFLCIYLRYHPDGLGGSVTTA